MNATATEALVTLTEPAANEIRTMLAAEADSSNKGLRVYVESGGCSGLQYQMQFDEKRPDDLVTEFFGVSVLIDSFSAGYLKGAIIDFSDALTGGGFKIKNPNAHSSCGCGKSFEA